MLGGLLARPGQADKEGNKPGILRETDFVCGGVSGAFTYILRSFRLEELKKKWKRQGRQ